MKWNDLAPAALGDVRVTRWADRAAQPFALQALWQRGALQTALRAREGRSVTVEFLCRASGAAALEELLKQVGAWLDTGVEGRLVLHHAPELYYRALCARVGEPAFEGPSARLQAVFACPDPRPHALATGLPQGTALQESQDFSFGGVHCLEHLGLRFQELEREIAPGVNAGVYGVSGRDGTLRLTGPLETLRTRTLRGRLYFPPGEDGGPLPYAQAAELAHRLAAWLTGAGRAALVFDHEPGWRCLAEVTEGLTLSRRDWESGCVEVAFTLQPWTERTQRSACTVTCEDFSQGAELTIPDLVEPFPHPWVLEAGCLSGGPLTGLTVRVGGRDVLWLTDIAAHPGETVTLNGEDMTARQGELSLLPWLGGHFEPLPPGVKALSVRGTGCSRVSLCLNLRRRKL